MHKRGSTFSKGCDNAVYSSITVADQLCSYEDLLYRSKENRSVFKRLCASTYQKFIFLPTNVAATKSCSWICEQSGVRYEEMHTVRTLRDSGLFLLGSCLIKALFKDYWFFKKMYCRLTNIVYQTLQFRWRMLNRQIFSNKEKHKH